MALATANGLRMYYEWHGDDRGAPLVLIMGLGGDTTGWGLQLAALTRRRRCLLFDNRGAGQTDAPDTTYTIREMAGDLFGLLDVLDVQRADLLGVSMGGAIAQEAALAAPDRVASLQLHATWAGPDPYFHAVVETLKRTRLQFGREGFLRAVGPWIFTPHCYAARPELIELVVQRGLAHPHPQPLHAYLRQAGAVLGHDTRDRLSRIRCPTLITVGSEDLLTPPRFARELAGLIPGARLEVIPGGGHGSLWEIPEAFNAACLAFLASLDPA